MDIEPVQLSFINQLVGKSDVSQQPQKEEQRKPATYKGIYAMHKYWSKKPHNLVADYIQRFSAPGDTVLDAFCGSGAAIIESVRLNRKAIGIDINPIAVFMTEMALTHINLRALQGGFDILKRKLAPVINQLYYTECSTCQNPHASATHTIWDGQHPKEVWYSCHLCRRRKSIKKASEDDAKATLAPTILPRWYPTDMLLENSRINADPGMRISALFTPRALVGLSLLFEEICQIEDEAVRDVLKFCFSGTLPQASNMVFVVKNRGKMTGKTGAGKVGVGSWVIGYWMPSEHFEIHVWRCFENRFRRILKGKQEVNAVIPDSATKCFDFNELNRVQKGYWVNVGTSTDINLPDNVIDYIFIDPPHGNRLPYLELSLMWNAWLGFKADFENEIVVSQAKSRQKDITDYRNRLAIAFSELWRVLKPDKYASIVFNSLDNDEWISLLNTCLGAGFEVVEIKPLAYSARSVVQDSRKNALKTDFVITCQKRLPIKPRKIIFSNESAKLRQSISKYLSECVDGAETYQILNHLFIDGIQIGKIFKISEILQTLEDKFLFVDRRWCLKN